MDDSVLFGIWWQGDDLTPACLCDTFEGVYKGLAYTSLDEAKLEADRMSDEAQCYGWEARYFAKEIPVGIKCLWIDDSEV